MHVGPASKGGRVHRGPATRTPAPYRDDLDGPDNPKPLPNLDPHSPEPVEPLQLAETTLEQFFSSRSCLSNFCRLALRTSHACPLQASAPLAGSLWPIPPPRWRYHACAPRSKRAAHRARYGRVRTRLLQVVIACLNWETLGHVCVPPREACIGSPLSDAQSAVLDRITCLLDHFLHAPAFVPDSLGRSCPKFYGLIKHVQELPLGAPLPGDEDLIRWCRCLESAFASSSGPRPPRPGPEPDTDSGVLPSRARSSADEQGPLPVVGSRIKWKCPPSFDPRPYLTDPLVLAAYEDPGILRKPPEFWSYRRPAVVHCPKDELLVLARRWDSFGALRVFPHNPLDYDEAVGLFSVGKDAHFDRLIINPTVYNHKSYSCNTFTRLLSPGWMLSLLHLAETDAFRFSAEDLTDYYYTFKVGEKRCYRNRIRLRFDADELQSFSCAPPAGSGEYLLALNTLAMGDSLAVEIAQQAHCNVLRSLCGALLPSETLRYRAPIPDSDFIEALAIDDHIGIQRLPLTQLTSEPELRDTKVFRLALDAYRAVGLVPNSSKAKRNVTSGVILGAEFDGVAGRVSAPRDRTLCLCVITSHVAAKAHCTRKLLDTLVGCWIHVLLFRRPLFALLDVVFREGRGLPADQPFRLSRQAVNELLLLSVLGSTAQADLRVNYDPQLFCMDASPTAGAICATHIGETASAELWRHCEQRGYYTRLESPVSAILSEKGIPHEGDNLFGPDDFSHDPASSDPLGCSFIPPPMNEGILYDCLEIFRGTGNWSSGHAALGLRVHDGVDTDGRRLVCRNMLDGSVVRELLGLACRGVIREWHCGVPCTTFGTLRRPRVRSKAVPAGFDPAEPVTALHNKLARRACLILTAAALRGQFVSVEQPSGSCLYHLSCFRRLAELGCVLTRFCFCAYGSPLQKRSVWMHNKPWVCALECKCTCPADRPHFIVQGSFTHASRAAFLQACRPSCTAVYGFEPKVGQSVASFSGAYPRSLVRRMASGALRASKGQRQSLPADALAYTAGVLDLRCRPDPPALNPSEPYPPRQWHEDPEWIGELCQSLPFKLKFKYVFRKAGHINVNEARVFKSFIKSWAKSSARARAVALLDSRVTMGAVAKGRSSSYALSRILQGCLGYIIGSALYPGLLHCYSADNRADGPTRERSVDEPCREEPRWFSELRAGRPHAFHCVCAASEIKKIPARWLRFLLLLAGDIERHPGPASPARRGPLNLDAGFAPSTASKMRRAFDAFRMWAAAHCSVPLERLFLSCEATELALRSFGLYLYAEGLPRYLLVYAITAVQDRFPSFRHRLTSAWQIDKKWQLQEPGACRAVLPLAAIRAALAVACLWGWHDWCGLVMLGFLAMLHPAEMLNLKRRDLVFPEDSFGHVPALFVHLRNPKTSRFARRQHGRIDDAFAIRFIAFAFKGLSLDTYLYPASLHSFRRQWNAVMSQLAIPCKAALRGATPGVLRGSGATHFYQRTEDVPLLAWRGRWARTKTLEFYLQEVAAQMLLGSLPDSDRLRIQVLDKACLSLLSSFMREQ